MQSLDFLPHSQVTISLIYSQLCIVTCCYRGKHFGFEPAGSLNINPKGDLEHSRIPQTLVVVVVLEEEPPGRNTQESISILIAIDARSNNTWFRNCYYQNTGKNDNISL